MTTSQQSAQGPDPGPSKEEESSLILEATLEDLSVKSTLDMFRMFFDIKRESWGRFRDRLHRHVSTNYSWATVQKDGKQRRECAERFLAEVGYEYWGTAENREKHLMEQRVKKGDVCLWPEHEAPLSKALVVLLEKTARGRRDSIATNVLSSCQESVTPPDTTTTGNEPASPGMSKDILAPSPTIKTSRSPEALRSAPRIQNQFPLAPSNNNGRILPPWRASARNPLSLHAHPPPSPNPLVARTDIQDVSGHGTIDSHHRHMATATYFLVRSTDDTSPQEPVCVPFEINQNDNTDRFLDRMVDKLDETDKEVWNQLYREMPTLRRPKAVSAMVYLRWSKVSFVIRRGTGDLQALLDRVGCAWRAKQQGELSTFEFGIELTLRFKVMEDGN